MSDDRLSRLADELRAEQQQRQQAADELAAKRQQAAQVKERLLAIWSEKTAELRSCIPSVNLTLEGTGLSIAAEYLGEGAALSQVKLRLVGEHHRTKYVKGQVALRENGTVCFDVSWGPEQLPQKKADLSSIDLQLWREWLTDFVESFQLAARS